MVLQTTFFSSLRLDANKFGFLSIRAIIVEDDPFIAEVLRDLLEEEHTDVELVAIAKNGGDGLRIIEKHKPDLVFLDVELLDMNAFEMLLQVPKVQFKTIFTTAHSHYAMKAFRFNALDYLLKPIKPAELSQSLARFKKQNQDEKSDEINRALRNLKETDAAKHILALETQSGRLNIELKEITFLEGSRNYSFIHFSNGQKELTSKTLLHFEEILDDKGFFRSHRTYLVNRLFVDDIKGDGFKMNDGQIIPISRRKKTDAKQWIVSS